MNATTLVLPLSLLLAVPLLGACSSDSDDTPKDGVTAEANRKSDNAPPSAVSSDAAVGEAATDSDCLADGDVQVLTGFSAPESAHFHEGSQSWFISNIAGETGAADGVGWISRVNAALEVVDKHWIGDLNSPAGLTSNATTLFVADIDRAIAIDIESATISEEWRIEDPGLLNDPALHQDGTLFVSDTFGQAIYRMAPGAAAELVIQTPELQGPNGLHLEGDTLTIASTGSFTDFEEEAGLFQLDLSTLRLTAVPDARGKFDGVEAYRGGLLLTDFRGMLLHLDKQGNINLLRNFVADGLVTSTADLGYDASRSHIAVPDLLGDQVLFFDLN